MKLRSEFIRHIDQLCSRIKGEWIFFLPGAEHEIYVNGELAEEEQP